MNTRLNMVHKAAIAALCTSVLACGTPIPDVPPIPVGPKFPDSLKHFYKPVIPPFLVRSTTAWEHYVRETRCPVDLCKTKWNRLRTVCNSALPLDGRVWLSRKDAPSCYCLCDEQYFAIDSARFLTQLREAKMLQLRLDERFEQWRSHKKNKTAIGQVERGLKPVSSDSTRIARSIPTQSRLAIQYVWTRFDQLNWLFAKFQEHYPIFIGELESYNGTDEYAHSFLSENFRDWELGDGPPADEAMTIYMPDVMVGHERTGWEMWAFMIAHELGHALGTTLDCGDRGVMCESEADHYAAEVILRRVFAGREYLDVTERAAVQFYAYMSDTRVESFPECGGPLLLSAECPPNGNAYQNCRYPPRSCRTATIRSARALAGKPGCVDNWSTDPERDCGP